MGIEGGSILCFGVGAGRLGGMSNACGTVIRNDDNIKLSSSNVVYVKQDTQELE